jgi:5-methylcytosine-specific restriction endonuclease McrA
MKNCSTCKNTIKCTSLGYCKGRKKTAYTKAKQGKIQHTLPEEKQKAWIRDNGLCVFCGRVGSDFHHVLWKPSERLYTDERNLAKNGVILCRQCHMSLTDGNTEIDVYVREYLSQKSK